MNIQCAAHGRKRKLRHVHYSAETDSDFGDLVVLGGDHEPIK